MQTTAEYSEASLKPAFWFLNSLVTFKAIAERANTSFTLLEQIAPLGFATPYHTHAGEDEAYYVLEGEITLIRDGEGIVLAPGSFASVSGHIPHGFRVSGSGPVKMLLILTPGVQFPPFVREAGEPAKELRLPLPAQHDFPRLKAISERYGSTILGPLPL